MTIERQSSKKFCDQCLIYGIKSPVQLFQLNDEEALLMCKNEDCTYMPSSNWGDLVVKRHISQINRSSSRKTRPWSLPSSSASSSQAYSVQSAPQRLQQPLKVHSKASTPCLVVKPPLTSAASNHSGERVVSPTPSLDSCASDEPEQKTLVPIAPFLCRHAHSFASFETKSVESSKHNEELLSSRDTLSNWSLNKSQARGLKRRGSSLDSDSLSSCSSSLDSRPESPVESSSKTASSQTLLNPTKRVILSAETFSKLQNGTCKLKLIKDAKGRTTNIKLVPLQGNNNLISNTPKSINPEENISENELDVYSSTDVEHPPELNSHHLPASDKGLDRPTTESKSSSAFSVQAHIDAINKHLAALSEVIAVNGSDVSLPAELSRLIPQTSNNSANSSKTLPESLEESSSTVGSNRELSGDSNTTGPLKNSLPQEDSYDYSDLDEYFIDNFTA